MLSLESRPYIDASVPVLREHGLAITERFYEDLFEADPKLKHIFNMGNQASGAQQQSLASAVFAYAANIDNAAALAPVISRIVNKHASLGIVPAHYPIIGRHLLGAIQQTLGAAATPALLAAWDEAYGLLAQALIDEEAKLYAASGAAPGAQRAMRVDAVKQEGELVKSLVLTPVDGRPAMDFRPGQYVTVTVDLPDGMRQPRQYSLSDAPGKASLRISVKREAAGAQTPAGMVSNWLHDHVAVGDTLAVGMPFGDFAPDTEGDVPIVMLSAGIGVTPMISALKRIAAVKPGRRVVFGYATRNARHHAHRDDVEAARAIMPNLQVVNFYEEVAEAREPETIATYGRMHVSALPVWSYGDTDVYLCGPLRFMQAQWRDLIAAGVPPARLHREVFGPDLLDHLH